MTTNTLKHTLSHPGRSRNIPAGTMPRRKQSQTILVIEHDDDLRATLCQWLHEAGFEAIGENTGRSGLSRILLREHTTKPIDGVLLSMKLEPFKSRLVLSELRNTHPSMPVVAMAGDEQLGPIEVAMQLGALGRLCAPFDRHSFKSKCSAFSRDPDQSD